MPQRARNQWFVGAMCLVLVLGAAPTSGANVAQIAEVGRHLLFGGLGEYGSVAMLYRDDGVSTPADFDVSGDDDDTNRIDGRDHDLNGDLTGSNDRAGVALDVDDTLLDTDDVTIVGNPPIQDESDGMDVEAYVNALMQHADVVYASNTTLTNQTIGGPSDYQIVVVQDAKLILKGTTAGYGLLVLYDTNPGAGLAELRMEDQARWYGVILVFSGDTPGNSDKVRLRFGKQNGGYDSGKGKGCGDDDGVLVLGSVITMGRQVTIRFPSDSVADVLYSSQAVANVDQMLEGTGFIWDKWRER